jgi:hypothetical protein
LKALQTIIQSHHNEDIEIQNSQTKITSKQKKDSDKLINCFFKLRESPLNFSMMEYLKAHITSNPDLIAKKKQSETGILSIFSQLDIKFVLKKFSELEKLKMLLLNEDQYRLFEYLPKPTILKNSKIHINYVQVEKQSPLKKGEIIHHTNDLLSKAKSFQRAFRNIKKKQELSEVDIKLIDCLDEDIVKILEEGELIGSEMMISRDPLRQDQIKSDRVKSEEDQGSVISEKDDSNRKNMEIKYGEKI